MFIVVAERELLLVFCIRHAHLDEPGREEWEGFSSGTKAAAAGILLHLYIFLTNRSLPWLINNLFEGGVTTLIDMPLNSFPSTVSEETLRLKVRVHTK